MVTVALPHAMRAIATNTRIEISNCKTPTDFFGRYIKNVLGGDGWGNTEIRKPLSDRHPILQWYHDVCMWQRTHGQTKDEEGVFNGVATGSVAAYYSVAYDLWTLDNHAVLQEVLIKRLRNKEQFQGARYELYVAAAMIRAGFRVDLENESDVTTTHCEMTITDPDTQRQYSVEAKSTGRSGMLGKKLDAPFKTDVHLKIYRKLQDALLKRASHPRIVFIDVNMPPHKGDAFKADWVGEAATQMAALEKAQSKVTPYPAALIFFTNHPYHYVGNDDVEPTKTSILTAINNPIFKQNGPDEDELAVAGAIDRFTSTFPEIERLRTSIIKHTKFPTSF